MNHLTDQQLDDILQGSGPQPAHLAECEHCQARLTEQGAIRGRLQSAFETVTADEALANSIRAILPSAESRRPEERPVVETLRLSLRRFLWPALAAAAVLIVAIPAIIFLSAPKPATAGEEALYRIYEHNLSPHADIYAGATPEELSAYLKDKLGFEPATPQPDVGMTLRGCCVSHFREEPVGSYVVDTDHGVISIIVLTDHASAAGLSGQMGSGGRTYETGSFAQCQMVAIELNGYTYCAVGETSYDFLIAVLDRLVPAAN